MKIIEKQLTLADFSENNRDRVIGDSLYRIILNSQCKWQVFEVFNDSKVFALAYSDETFNELEEAINFVNSIQKEREFSNRMFEKLQRDK